MTAGRRTADPRTAEPRAVRELLARVRATIERRGMLAGGESVVVAVSGGPDSLALLHALARLAGPLRLDLSVAHFDHRLRAGSGADAGFVAREAGRLGLPFVLGVAPEPPRRRGASPEEAAREARLAFLEEIAAAAGADRIATGHTMDDQAETVLMRLVLGAGRRGLGGIPPVRMPYVRPLIDVRRAETVAFCRALRLRPRTDPTNADPAYLRNAVRVELVPLLAGRFNRRAVEALARTADVLRDEDAFLDERARKALEPEDAGEEVRLPVEALRALPPALARRAVRAAVERAADAGPGRETAGRRPALGAEQTERTLALALGGETGRALDLPLGLKVRVEYGWLVFGSAPSPAPPVGPLAIEVPGETNLPAWDAQARTWFGARPAQWPDGRGTCVLDAARVGLPLGVRRPRPGDRFRPLGLRGEKKLGDFFTDAKVPRAERARSPVVTDARDRIVWVAGHRIDDRFKVTGRTTRTLWIEWREVARGAE